MRRVLGQSTHMIGKRNVGGFLSRAVRPSPSSSIVFGARNVHTFFSTFASTTPLSSASLSAQHQRHFHTSQHDPNTAYATTILAVRKNGEVVLIGDGQVTLGSSVVKPDARKVRTLNDGKIMVGFAGATADCFTLIERFEEQLEVHSNQLLRAGVELAKNWRMDKYLRHLNAMIIAVDKDVSVTITGQGDIMSEPDDGVISIGSGSIYARSAARALIDIDGLSAEDIAMKSMKIASEQCIYTNDTFVVERLSYGAEETETPEGEKKEE